MIKWCTKKYRETDTVDEINNFFLWRRKNVANDRKMAMVKYVSVLVRFLVMYSVNLRVQG